MWRWRCEPCARSVGLCRRVLAGVATLLMTLVPTPSRADIVGKPRVIDGDTIEIAGERIRLYVIEAPPH